MAITKAKKGEIFTKLTTTGKNQSTVLVFTTRNAKETVNASKNWQLRSNARKNGIIVQVVKNTLINKAFNTIPNKLIGQSYIAYLENTENQSEVMVPKVVVDQVEKNFVTNFDIIGSIVNGEFYDKDKTIALSKVPSFEESMAMVAGSLKQITAKIALTIKEVPGSVVRVVKAAKAE